MIGPPFQSMPAGTLGQSAECHGVEVDVAFDGDAAADDEEDGDGVHHGGEVILDHDVAVLWEGSHFFVKGGRSAILGGLGGPGGLGDPPERWGASSPTFLKGFPGPRGRPDPQNDRFPILKQVSIFLPSQRTSTVIGVADQSFFGLVCCRFRNRP